MNYDCQQKHVLSAHHFALDHLFSSFWKTTYASQIKFSRLAQVDVILERKGDLLVYPGFTCQISKSSITQRAPPTQWPERPGILEMLSLFPLVYLSVLKCQGMQIRDLWSKLLSAPKKFDQFVMKKIDQLHLSLYSVVLPKKQQQSVHDDRSSAFR